MAGSLVGAGSSTLISQTLENITEGGKKRSALEIGGNTLASMTVAGLTTKFLKVDKITAGRGNYGAVYSAGLTKIETGVASKMSILVLNKGINSQYVGYSFGIVYSSLRDQITYYKDHPNACYR